MLEVQDAVRLVVGEHGHGLSQSRLLKILWLAELKHYERTGERLTDAGWFRWDNGPYSKDVINTAKSDDGLEQEQVESDGRRMLFFHQRDTPQVQDEEAAKLLKYVCWLYNKYELGEILEEVYDDAFFKSTAYGRDFEFARLPDCRQIELTEDQIEEMWRSPTSPVTTVADLFGDEAEGEQS